MSATPSISSPRSADRRRPSFARLAGLLQRVLHRRLDLRWVAPTGIHVEAPSDSSSVRWLAESNRPPGLQAVLACPADSQVTFDIVVPSPAIVRTRVAAGWLSAGEGGAPVVATLEVTIAGTTLTSERPLSFSAGVPQWETLTVRCPQAGAARIVLRAALATRTSPAPVVYWGDPTVDAWRSLSNVVHVLRTSMSSWRVAPLLERLRAADERSRYHRWSLRQEPSAGERRRQSAWTVTRPRVFTLLTCAVDGAWDPRPTADSLHAQTYGHWEWLIACRSQAVDAVNAALGTADRRVRVLPVDDREAASGWNAGLADAGGGFVAVLGAGDTLAPDALFVTAQALETTPDAAVLYSDEDRWSKADGRHAPQFKPAWSPELLLSGNYIGRLAWFRTTLAREAGGFRSGIAGSEEWDLCLRLSLRTPAFYRIPRCLYHRGAPDEVEAGEPESDQVVLASHCATWGRGVAVSRAANAWRVTWTPQTRPLVSIIVPNRNAAAVLTQCVRGIRDGTAYAPRELVIVDNGSTDADVLSLYDRLVADAAATIVPFKGQFNFSAACNAGAAAARGDLLLFLNNDIEIVEPDWLDELVRWALRPAIGIVGAQLLYPDRTIQHAGVVLGLGLVGHLYARADPLTRGLFGTAASYRNCLAVTGACQLMRREVFDRLGGFDERFRISFSDVVLCLNAWTAGYRVVYTPYARLIHHESYSRQRDDSPQDKQRLAEYLQANGFEDDPYFHPELNPRSVVPALRPPYEPTPAMVVRAAVERALAADMGAR